MKSRSPMTEADWSECIDPEQMLTHLGDSASVRKKRLFACACVRRVWTLLTDERLQQAVELVERCADKPAEARQLQRHRRAVRSLRQDLEVAGGRRTEWTARAARAAAQAVEALLPASGPILEAPRDNREPPDVVSATRTARTAARAVEALREERGGKSLVSPVEGPGRLELFDAVDLLREIFGNPFRAATIAPGWLTWNDSIVPKMARAIYTERRFCDLPYLADALEEAGCASADILTHCRAPMEHVRGCWAVDALLGMK